jgi:hypothetical protein
MIQHQPSEQSGAAGRGVEEVRIKERAEAGFGFKVHFDVELYQAGKSLECCCIVLVAADMNESHVDG